LPTALDRFLDGLSSWQAEFTQSTVDARGRSRAAQPGLLIVQRPGRFRWQQGADGEQVMVADGRNLWFYDRDLEQVTVRPAAGSMTATPAMLLAGTAPVREIFEVVADGRREGLEWVRVRPRGGDAEFREALLGFSGLDLQRMRLLDKLGQESVLVFRNAKRNVPIDGAQFRFTPPPGADLIGRPLP
jgi:outer membrane lipoprotein carrier protein